MKIFVVVLGSLLICIVIDTISYKMMKIRNWMPMYVADHITYHFIVFSSSLEVITKCVFQLQKLR